MQYDALFNATVSGSAAWLDARLKKSFTVSLSCFALVLFTVIGALLHLTSTSFRDHTGKQSRQLLQAWWKWMRFAMLTVFLVMLIGIIAFFIAVNFLATLKFGSSTLGTVYDYRNITFAAQDFHKSFTMAEYICILGGGLVLGMVVPGSAGEQKNRRFLELKETGTMPDTSGIDTNKGGIVSSGEVHTLGVANGAQHSPAGATTDNGGLLSELVAQQTRTNELLEQLLSAGHGD
jgi:hypothetical protein